ncbi:hypothetical protein BLA29_008972 [Euroglyphus maynei]|uniref:MYND-type domain-containing protein n=1 Tax=Euroglyphus maynei TaxID=6958 RepID=A0A1Y3BPQ1_EURMA|nr:hypothetical protein BLA29_008972 [Euroglyphus maynei]
MARLFFIRAKQLAMFDDDEDESIKQALINIDFALRFRLSKKYLLAKSALLARSGQMDKAIQLLSILLGDDDYQFENKEQLRRFLRFNSHCYDVKMCSPDWIRIFINDDEEDNENESNFYVDHRCTLTSRPGQGRYFVANEMINNDELIFREHPYSTVMFPESSLLHCQHCFRLVRNTFFPCINCTEVIYCSAKCNVV